MNNLRKGVISMNYSVTQTFSALSSAFTQTMMLSELGKKHFSFQNIFHPLATVLPPPNSIHLLIALNWCHRGKQYWHCLHIHIWGIWQGKPCSVSTPCLKQTKYHWATHLLVMGLLLLKSCSLCTEYTPRRSFSLNDHS